MSSKHKVVFIFAAAFVHCWTLGHSGVRKSARQRRNVVAKKEGTKHLGMSAAEAVPRNEFSDVYNEVGPDNVGGMGDEPSCTVTLFTLNTRGQDVISASGHTTYDLTSGTADLDVSVPKTTLTPLERITAKEITLDAAAAAAAQGPSRTAAQDPGHTATEDPTDQGNDQQDLYVAVDQMECDPHKVVAVRPGQHNQMLLGLSNDVDCAVAAFSCSSKLLLESQHLHSIPALAYVAAGEHRHMFTHTSNHMWLPLLVLRFCGLICSCSLQEPTLKQQMCDR